MSNSNLVEVTMETADTVIFRAISEIPGKSKRPVKPEFIILLKTFLDDSDVSDGSFWEGKKSTEDQGVIINRQFRPNV